MTQLMDVENISHSMGSISNFSELESYIKNHRAIHHPLFDYLQNCASLGFTSKQYQIYRDNYLLRTFYTIPSVAFLVAASALNVDIQTLTTAGKNLYEESGRGDASDAHSKLLVDSHNLHARTVFNLDDVSLKEIHYSKWIIQETRSFIESQEKLYKNKVYCIVLGAAFAHESAATPMLSAFYHNLFKSYRNYYNDCNFEDLSKYFLVHIDGLEEEHADNAGLAARRNCINEQSLNQLFIGSSGFLNSQACLWDGLYRTLIEAEDERERVPVNPF